MRLISNSYEDFYDVLAELKKTQSIFKPANLQRLPYDQLILAAMGNAGSCRCSVEDVIAEKQERRAIVLSHPNRDTFKLDDNLMSNLQNDLLQINTKIASWKNLSIPSKIYFKLICLENHSHDAFKRLSEVVELFKEAEETCALPQQIASSLRLEFQSALLSKSSEIWVRDAATKVSNILYGFITNPEIETIDSLELKDYQCSAGCFYPLQT